MSESPDNDDLRLQPTDPEADAAQKSIRERPPSHVSPAHRPDPPAFQFDLKSMLWLTAGIAVLCGVFQFLPPRFIAAVLGFATVMALWLMLTFGIRHPIARILWAILLIAYLAFCIYSLA
ncbi:MAG: hypothetical protein AAF456_08005 [Planctomycetota bacterium]